VPGFTETGGVGHRHKVRGETGCAAAAYRSARRRAVGTLSRLNSIVSKGTSVGTPTHALPHPYEGPELAEWVRPLWRRTHNVDAFGSARAA